MAKAYGVPYMGSKNKIAPWIVEHLPRAEVLVEPFAGGCAITHCALEAGAFERFCAMTLWTRHSFLWTLSRENTQTRNAGFHAKISTCSKTLTRIFVIAGVLGIMGVIICIRGRLRG